MAIYGPGCNTQNIIWTEAKLRSIYYFVGDRPVHKLPFGPKCYELFVISYSMHANLSDDMFLLLHIQTKNEIGQNLEENIILIGPGHYTKILTVVLEKTNRENKNVKYNIYKYRFSKKNIFLHGGYDPKIISFFQIGQVNTPKKKSKKCLVPIPISFFSFFSYNILISGTNVRKRLGSHHDRKKQELMIF